MPSSLIGLVSNGPQQTYESPFNRIAGSLMGSKSQSTWVHRENGFTCYASGSESIACSPDHSLLLALYGTVYGLDALNCQSKDSDMQCHEPSKKLLQLYLREGSEGLCGLNGHYVIMIWEKEFEKLTLINDRCGFKRFYYCQLPDSLVFASEYKAICVVPDFSNRLNEQALADLMYLGFILKDRTLFENINLLPAASVLTYCHGRLSTEKYWDYQFFQTGESILSEEEYMWLFAKKLQEAVNRRISGQKKIILPISGGLDSRTMAGMLWKSGFKGTVQAFSHGHRHCYDVKFGRKIAKRLGFNHTFLPFSGDYLAKYANKLVRLTEGNISCFAAYLMVCHDFININEADAVLTGFIGDVLTGTNVRKKLKGKTDEEIIRATFEIPLGHLEILSKCLKRRVYERVVNVTINDLKVDLPDPFYKAQYLTLSQRQRRYMALNLFCLEPLVGVIAPFIDNEFMDFILKVPLDFLEEQSLYKKMIVKYLPEVARIPHTETGLPLARSWFGEGIHWRWDRFYRYYLPRWTDRKWGNHNFKDYSHPNESIRTGSREFFLKKLKNNPFLAEYFDMDQLHNLLNDHMDGKTYQEELLCALLAFALWAEIFIDGSEPLDVTD